MLVDGWAHAAGMGMYARKAVVSAINKRLMRLPFRLDNGMSYSGYKNANRVGGSKKQAQTIKFGGSVS
jgi:hypothetical protein